MKTFPWHKIADSVFSFREKPDGEDEIIVGFSINQIRFGIKSKMEFISFPEPEFCFSVDLSTPKSIGNDILDIPCAKKPTRFDLSWKTFIEKFIAEMENDGSIFATSPFANKARKKLHTSIVYKIIAAKKKYKDYVEDHKALSLDIEEYNHIVSEYADLLMFPKLTSVLQPLQKGKCCFFENPEKELREIIKKDIAIRKEAKLKLVCKENTIKRIQNFLLMKHETISAYSNHSAKIYKTLVWFMAIWSICFISSCLCLSMGKFYSVFIFVGAIIFAVFLVLAFINNRNSLLPRIIIALIASWLLIAISDDFVASQLFVTPLRTGIVMVFSSLIVIGTLWLECKEHSRYCSRKDIIHKIIPIFFFSIFLSLFLGIIVQFATFRSLIKTNDVLPSVQYNSNFMEIENCKSNTQLLINNLEAYKNEAMILGIYANDSVIQSKDSVLLSKRINIIQEVIKKKLLLSSCDSSSIVHLNNQSVAKNINTINGLLLQLNEDMNALGYFQKKHCNTEFLLNAISENLTFSCDKDMEIYGKFFVIKPEEKVGVRIELIDCYFFPRMLVFHAFIVLLISFVVQIIVSGKTVTEGL